MQADEEHGWGILENRCWEGSERSFRKGGTLPTSYICIIAS